MAMKKIELFILTLSLWIFSFPFVSGAEQNHLKINCTIHSPYEAFFFRLVEEVCTRNNITVSSNTPPVGRSLMNVNQGIDDGDGPRIGGLSSTYPNMVCVPEPFGNFVFGAFANKEGIRIDGWDSLSNLNVAYITGWKIFDRRVTKAKSITKVKNKDLLFKLLEADRTDVALITKLSGYAMVQRLHLKGIRFLEPPLAVVPNYLYLNKRYEALVPKLAETLKTLKQDGTYQRLYDDMISPHLLK
jgi:polar amino acid transport system substrate-binding protein